MANYKVDKDSAQKELNFRIFDENHSAEEVIYPNEFFIYWKKDLSKNARNYLKNIIFYDFLVDDEDDPDQAMFNEEGWYVIKQSISTEYGSISSTSTADVMIKLLRDYILELQVLKIKYSLINDKLK